MLRGVDVQKNLRMLSGPGKRPPSPFPGSDKYDGAALRRNHRTPQKLLSPRQIHGKKGASIYSRFQAQHRSGQPFRKEQRPKSYWDRREGRGVAKKDDRCVIDARCSCTTGLPHPKRATTLPSPHGPEETDSHWRLGHTSRARSAKEPKQS